MPIGKDSIRKRVIGSDCAACGECADKAPLAEKTTVAERAPLAGKAPAADKAPARRSPGRPRKDATHPNATSKSAAHKTAQASVAAPKSVTPVPAAPALAVTESVLTNVSPEVVEKVVGHAEGATADHVQITDRMPDYLL